MGPYFPILDGSLLSYFRWIPRIATRYGLDGTVFRSRLGYEIFRNRLDRQWGPRNPLYNGSPVSFLGVKQPGRRVDHLPLSSAEVIPVLSCSRVHIFKLALCTQWPSSVVAIATGYGLDGQGSNRGGGDIFRTFPDPALGPTQPTIQWLPVIFRG